MVGMNKKKKIISSLVIVALVVGLFITARVNMTTISDDEVPLAGGQVAATYYVYNPSLRNIWTYFCDYVGEGSISERVAVDNDAAYVNSLIVSSPDYSSTYPGYYIEWRAIYLMRNKTYVVGFFCDPPAAEEKSIAEEMEPTEDITEVDPEHVDELVDEVIDMIEEQNPSEVLDEAEVESIQEAEPVNLTLSASEMNNATASDYPAGSTIRYDGWKVWNGWKSGALISGDAKTDYLDDAVYMSMKLPDETKTYVNKKNPYLMDYKPDGCVNALGIGALYRVEGAVLPDKFNLYLGKLATYVLYEGSNEWVTLDFNKTLDDKSHFSLYNTPSYTFGRKLTESEVEYGDTYTKYSLRAADLDSAVLHFWGHQKPAAAENIRAMVTMYEVWTDTPEAVGKFSAAIGIDQREASGKVHQAFSGKNYAITQERRIVMGHNIPDYVYDELVESGLSPEICLTMFNQE